MKFEEIDDISWSTSKGYNGKELDDFHKQDQRSYFSMKALSND